MVCYWTDQNVISGTMLKTMMVMGKKGQTFTGPLTIQSLVPAGVIITLVILILFSGSLILSSVEDVALTQESNVTVNESVLLTVNQFFTLSKVTGDEWQFLINSSVNITNGTSKLVPRVDFHVDIDSGTINVTNGTSKLFEGGPTKRVNVSYTSVLNVLSADVNVTRDGQKTLLNITGLLPNVGTVIGAGIIIGVLLTIFVFSRRNQV